MSDSATGATVFRFDGETAVVTGAGSGIGQAIAVALAAGGARVAAVDRVADALAETVERASAVGGELVALPADVTTEDGLAHAVDLAETRLGALTLAVNSAGIADATPALELTTDQFERMYRVNVTGLFRSCQVEARAMIRGGRGAIVNLASISGIVSHREMLQAHYNSAKAAVAHLTRSLATEWADRGLRVNSVAPGFTLTPMNAREEVATRRASIERLIPMGRFAEVEDVVGPVLFLLSSSASYCTGVELVVDGGYTLL